YPVGSLIGSLCPEHPSTNPSCPRFLIGNGTTVENPFGLPLWLRANDSDAFPLNAGAMRVQVRKQVSFKTYWDQYESWFSSECNEDGTGCGLGYILENIAYIPNPYTAAKALLIKQFPDFPDAVMNLILQQVNYLIEMKILAR